MIEEEQPSAQLRARLVAAFNDSYRGYQRTYGTCTASAKTAADRFFAEGAGITRGLAGEIAGTEVGAKADDSAGDGAPAPQ
jgi:uncharacterized protein (TIGR02301 family)